MIYMAKACESLIAEGEHNLRSLKFLFLVYNKGEARGIYTHIYPQLAVLILLGLKDKVTAVHKRISIAVASVLISIFPAYYGKGIVLMR